jgi:hypothetical protein
MDRKNQPREETGNQPNGDLVERQGGNRSTDPEGEKRGLGDQDRNRDRRAPERDKNPDDLE